VQARLDEHLTTIFFSSSIEEVIAELAKLSDLVEREAVVVPTSRLTRLRSCLEGDAKLWSKTMSQAVDVFEAQCHAIVGSLVQQLCKAKGASGCASKISDGFEKHLAQVQKNLTAAEQRVAELKKELQGAQQSSMFARQVKDMYKMEADQFELDLQGCDVDAGEETAESGGSTG